jgi:hypothetical protein
LIIQSLFDQAKMAAITTSVVYFGSSILSVLVEDHNSSVTRIFLCTLSPTVAMVKLFYVIGALEGSKVGTRFSNIGQQVAGFSVKSGIQMFLLDTVLTYLLGLYLDQVMPKTFGVRKEPLFFLRA